MADEPFDALGGLFKLMGVDERAQQKLTALMQIANALPNLGILPVREQPTTTSSPVAASPVVEPAVTPPPVQPTPTPEKPFVKPLDIAPVEKIVLDPSQSAEGWVPPVDKTSKTKPASNGTVSINGLIKHLVGPGNIVVAGRQVVIDGEVVPVDFSNDPDVVKIEVSSGTIANLIVNGMNVSVNNVSGNAMVIGDASIGAIGGSADISGDVSVGTISGNLDTTGDVTAQNVVGKVTAQGDVSIRK